MKKILSLLMLLVAIVTGAKASSESDLTAITSSTVIVADGLNGTSSLTSGTLYNNGTVLSLGGSGYSTSKGSSTYNETTYKNVYQIKNSRQIAIKVGMDATVTVYGGTHDSRAWRIGTSSAGNEIAAGENGEGVVSGDVDGSTTPKVVYINATGDLYLALIVVEMKTPAVAPVITTNLPTTAGVTVGVAEEFSIVATGATSYQWYKATSTTANPDNDEAIQGATTATYSYTATAAGTVNLYCVASNSVGSATSNVCAVTATAPTNPPVITTNLEAAYNVIKGQTQELSIVAEDASSYQWYLDGVAVEGATTDTYTFTAGSTIGATNAVYCAAINAAGATNSATATITTVGRTDCELTNIKFSNGAYGAISNLGSEDLTVQVPYMAGTEAPTVEEASINISDGATYVLSGNTLTVTAEDETTSKEFTINAVEITPLTVTADVTENFTEVPSWVFNLYGYDSTKGLKFAKAVDQADNMRIAKGNTRQYYFIGAAKSLTLTNTGTTRKVNVYVNGTKVISDTNNDALGAITLDETAPNLVIVEAAAGTNGDGGFSAFTIEAAAATTETIKIPSEGVLTYVTQNDVDFSSVNGAFKAYVPTGISEDNTKVLTSEVTSVPANTAVLLKGAAGTYDVEIIASAEEPEANIFQVSNGSVTGGDNIFAYSKTNQKFMKVGSTVTIPEGKCYLVIEGVGQNALDVDFEGEATAVEAIAEANEAEAAPVKVIKNGKLYIGNYNVAGQLVK